MTKLLLALHLVFAIFAVGPLVFAATTAGRGVRRDDAAATAGSARLLRLYGIASVLVVGTGAWLASRPAVTTIRVSGWYAYSATPPRRYADYLPGTDNHLASFGETWIWLSLVLWAVAIAATLAVVVPTLQRATRTITAGGSAKSLTGRVAAVGGVVGLIFVAITMLMVYRPGR